MDLSGIRTPIVICGPSGVGKGTLIGKLMGQHPDSFGFSVSHTTRGPRPGEQNGAHYYFTDTHAMSAQVAQGMFLEHAQVHGNMYGTSLAAVARVSSEGKHCVLDIDVQGAQQVRASALGDRCLFIFVAPPSEQELERRLRNRGTETEDKVLQRLANATSEIAKAQEPGLFHHTLVNGDLEQAYMQLQQLLNSHVPGLLPEAEAAAAPAPATREAQQAAVPTDGSNEHAAAVLPAAVDESSTAPAPPAGEAAAEPAALTNGTAAAAGAGAAAAVAAAAAAAAHSNGGTSTLLDFGFGASAGPAAAAKGMPVRQYMDVTVIPVLREGLKALNVARPDDPWQYLADYLVAHKPLTHA
ncbi:P-loop containing nucleoside triphosphate hydrolase protein [Scenedesmus sp. NREL 46B-D3]|nr:P-loop containing nucleoside triphosphate hydrolase protein [Scenedesmus sp. NREL 46B-D3]